MTIDMMAARLHRLLALVTLFLLHCCYAIQPCPTFDASTPPPSSFPYFCKEAFLQKLTLLDYDTMTPPQESLDSPVVVTIGLNVFKIVEINIQEATMQVNAWVRMSWTDKRLSWNKTEVAVDQLSYYASNDKEVTDIYVPDLEIYNQEESLYEFADKNAQVSASGGVFWSRPGTLKLLCAFRDLGKHPFDKTSCAFEMGGWAKSGAYVDYVMSDPPISFSGEETSETTFQQYSIIEKDTRASRVEYFYPCCPKEPWPVLQYSLTVDRASSFYVLKVLIPNILFTYLSFFVFWFDVRSGERLSFGITILLAQVAVDIITAELLPICEEYLFIEILVGVSLLFSFFALVETCLVVYWYYKNDDNEAEENTALLAMNKAVKAMTNAFQRDNERDPVDKFGEATPATEVSDESDPTDDVNESLPTDDISDHDVFMDCEEGAPTSALRQRRPMSRMASLRSSFSKKKSVSFVEKENTRKAYLQERNLQEKYLAYGRRLDKVSRFLFIILYTLFVAIMFSTIPLWE